MKQSIFDPSEPEQKAAILRLSENPQVQVFDTIDRQLADLVQTRSPQRKLSGPDLADAVNRHLAGTPLKAYGRWIHYPWSNRLVHLLPSDEFRELRTNRNRYKITAEEQSKLAQSRIAIVGLSAGHSVALTLAQEGVGGHIRVADFDTLDLSNLNRLRAGVHDLGINKAILAARQIAEIDPFVNLETYAEGVTASNVSDLLNRVDLIVEECDDIYMKFMLRERARELGIPVIMATSHRGCIDIERFDLEPSRPLFHGRLNSISAEKISQLSTADRRALALEIVDVSGCSERDRMSLAELGKTILTWPQLGSMVTLGGAVVTDVARRVLLGTFRRSGRFYVDMEQLVSDKALQTQVQ